MDRLPMEIGRAVQSLQGRDAGRCLVILQVVDDQFVLMADGLTRKLDHPKKKKIKHLHPKPVRMEGVEDGLKSHQLLDSDLRMFMRLNGLEIDQPLCKEG